LGPSGLCYANFEFLGYNLYTKRRFDITIEAKKGFVEKFCRQKVVLVVSQRWIMGWKSSQGAKCPSGLYIATNLECGDPNTVDLVMHEKTKERENAC
jgi:hypothetical protein|tara:strand:- start:1107 stop:1397 length:291 start_codon:yes stop_codon:yes gene_type:complete